MAFRQRRWKRKNNAKYVSKMENKSITSHRTHTQNTIKSSWVLAKDVRSQRMQSFITFFTKTGYTKQDMNNASDYIEGILAKLTKADRSSLFNQSELLITRTAVSVPEYFDPFCHCINQIIRSWKYITNILYQKYYMKQWISVARVLLKYDIDIFCCKHCKKHLTKYTQYHKCERHPASHCTAFQMIFKAFREDLYVNTFRKKQQSAPLHDQGLIQRIDEMHNCLYTLLAVILKKYRIEIPLIRLLKAFIPKVYMILPVFPSYKMLKSLLSIEGIVPFKRIAKTKVNSKTFYKEMHQFEEHNVTWSLHVPIHWQVGLIYADQQSFAHNIYSSITAVVPDLHPFIPFIVEYIYVQTSVEFFFTNGISYTQINECIVYMKQCMTDDCHNRIKSADGRDRYRDNRNRLCNTTTKSVVRSWLHAFAHPEYKLTRFGFLRDQTANHRNSGGYDLCEFFGDKIVSRELTNFRASVEEYCLNAQYGLSLWKELSVAKYIKECPQCVFELVSSYRPFTECNGYNEYVHEYGFGSFYEEVVTLANTDPLLCFTLFERVQQKRC